MEPRDTNKNKAVWSDTHMSLFCLKHEPEIPLTESKDPKQSVENELPIQDNAYGSQTSINNWQIDSQNDDLGDLLQRFNFLGMKQMESCGHHPSQNLSNLHVEIQQEDNEVVMIFFKKYQWYWADFL